MGQVQITQIKHRLENTLVPYIDISDLGTHGGDVADQMRLSRALAAFVIMKLTGFEAEHAAATVTDGSTDNGIDAVAVLPEESRIVVVQAKWTETGKGGAVLAEMIKYRDGLNDLVSLKWSKFNKRIQDRKAEIEALLLEPSVQIDVVFAHTGTGKLAEEVRQKIEEYIADLNDPTETARFTYLGQVDLHRMLIDEHQSPKIDLTVELSDWGQIDGSPKAVYGQVSAADVADWYLMNGRSLLAKNVRVVLPDSEVNESLVETLRERPELFWYYNNGVTVLCDSIDKAVAGGTDRRVGNFSFSGVSVVNGAQTVGALARSRSEDRDLSSAKVMARFISLEESSDQFASEVTRATNTQNRIGGRDFLSLDPQQARLRDEFAVDKLVYVYRSGETDPPNESGCNVLEATVALACSQPTAALATQAKREVGRLWDDISKSPYKVLFNSSTNYLRVWHSVQIMRRVDAVLSRLATEFEGRERGIVIHGNRLLLHLVFRQLDTLAIDQATFNVVEMSEQAEKLVISTLPSMFTISESDFPGYPASLFKNAKKSDALASMVLDHIKSGEYESAVGLPTPVPF